MFLTNLRAVWLLGLMLVFSYAATAGEKIVSYADGHYAVQSVPPGWGEVKGAVKCGNATFVVTQFAIGRYNERLNTLEQLTPVGEDSNKSDTWPAEWVTLQFDPKACEFDLIEPASPDDRNFFVQILAHVTAPPASSAASETRFPMVIGIIHGTARGGLTRHFYSRTKVRPEERRVVSWEWATDVVGARFIRLKLNPVDPGVLYRQWTELALYINKNGRLQRIVPPTAAQLKANQEKAFARLKAAPQ